MVYASVRQPTDWVSAHRGPQDDAEGAELGEGDGGLLASAHVVGSVREVLARDSPNRKKHADEERISSSTVQTLARPSTKAG